MIKYNIQNNVGIYFSLTEFAMNIEIIKSDLISTWVIFYIGNQTAYTQGEITQSFTFAKVNIVVCKFQDHWIGIEAFTPKSVALIQVLDTITNYSAIINYKSHFGLFGYIIDNCTFTSIKHYGLKSFVSQYIRITNSKFIIEKDDSYCPEGGCAINVKGRYESGILDQIFNQSCQFWWDCIIVHVDNSEFVGSTRVTPGGVIPGEDIHL